MLRIDHKNTDALIIKSQALFNLNKFEECNITADKVLVTDPKNIDAL